MESPTKTSPTEQHRLLIPIVLEAFSSSLNNTDSRTSRFKLTPHIEVDESEPQPQRRERYLPVIPTDDSPAKRPPSPLTLITPDTTLKLSVLAERISLTGRHSLSFKCPLCQKPITTKIVETRNEKAVRLANVRYTFMGFLLLFFITMMLILISAKEQSKTPAIIGFPVSTVCVIVLMLCVKFCNDRMDSYNDVTHFCPNCDVILGISNGKDEFVRQTRQQ